MPSSLDTSDDIALEDAPLSRHGLIKFREPSLIGVLLFLLPFSRGDTINIGVGFAADGLKVLLVDAL